MSVRIQPVEPVPYIDVIDKDIAAAKFHGVAAGLKRHRDKSPEELADAALEIMEAIHLKGYKEKVWWFAKFQGHQLYDSITIPAKKAEFAIRLAKLLTSSDQREWCARAQTLVSREEVVKKCSKKALVTLSLLYASAKNLDQTLTWLNKAQTSCEDYRDAAYEFYLKGASKEGLQVMREGYGKIPYSTKDLVVLISYGLSHPEILNDSAYKKTVLSFKTHWKQETMILKALCFLDHVEEAIDLAEQLSLKKDSISVYPFLILSECIPQSPLREKLITRIIHTAFELMKRVRKTTGYEPLYYTVMHKHLKVEEALRLCDQISKPSDRAHALWERACGILVKWGYYRKKREERDSTENQNLQTILNGMRPHLIKTDFTSGSDYWLDVIRTQIGCGFFEDVEETGSMWREWHKTRGSDWENHIYNAIDILFLSYQFLFELLTGRIEEGKASLKMSRSLHLEMKTRYPHQFTHNYRRIIAGTALRILWNIENFAASPEMIQLLKELYNQEYTLEELLGEGIDSPFSLLEEIPHCPKLLV